MAKGVFVGLATIDVVYRVDALAGPNTKRSAHSQEIFVGGPATNAAIAFSFLGGAATLAAAVGRHAIARLMRDEFEKYSIRLIDLNPEFAQAPAISAVSVTLSGERSVISANAGRIGAAVTQVDEATLEHASIVLVDGHQMVVCQAWAHAAKERGIPVVLDGGSWKDGTERLLQNVDVAICSADFLPPGCATEQDVFRYLQDCGVHSIAISHGPEPVRYASPQGNGFIDAPRVEAVDTMGTGDILHGAYCFYASAGYSSVEALRSAMRVASESCWYPGTREWMRHVKQRAISIEP